VITESADTYVDAASPAAAFVESPAMKVNATAFGLIRFALTALPAGTTTQQIAKATMQLWLMPDSLSMTGSISVYEVTSDFAMRTVTYNTRPSLASVPVTTVALPGNSRYVEVDITPLVKKWLTAPAGNYGVAVLPASFSTAPDVNLGTKWNLAASQPPILDITVTSMGPAGPPGPQGPAGPQGPPGPAAPVLYTMCAGGATSPVACSCSHVLSQTQVSAAGCAADSYCSANIPDNPCSTSALPYGTRNCNQMYYGFCCVCSS
jgi:hypothetical protein